MEVAALKMLLATYYYPDEPLGDKHTEFFDRMSLVCTPFSGGDKDVDGWVVCAMGSPPKGTIVIFGGGSRCIAAYHIYGGSRQIDLQGHREIVEAFQKRHLDGKNEPFTIP